MCARHSISWAQTLTKTRQRLLLLWQDAAFLTSGVHIWPFQVEMTIFMVTSNHVHISFPQLKAVSMALQHWDSVLYQQVGGTHSL